VTAHLSVKRADIRPGARSANHRFRRRPGAAAAVVAVAAKDDKASALRAHRGKTMDMASRRTRMDMASKDSGQHGAGPPGRDEIWAERQSA